MTKLVPIRFQKRKFIRWCEFFIGRKITTSFANTLSCRHIKLQGSYFYLQNRVTACVSSIVNKHFRRKLTHSLKKKEDVNNQQM